MRRRFFNEFLYQVFSLIIAVIIVHAIYVAEIRPRATEIIAEQNLRIQEDANYTPERSVWVLIRDFEQEACFILMFWSFAIMSYKAYLALNERKLLQRELLNVREGVRILPEDTREYGRVLQSLPGAERWSPEQADVLLDTFQDKFRLLARYPDAGRRRDELAPGVRSLGTSGFVILYRVHEEVLDVVRLVHGSRDLEGLLLKDDGPSDPRL